MICSVCRRIGGTHFRPLFMPATQSFCPLRKIFARFSDFWSRVTFLPQICALFAPNLQLDHSSGPSLLLRQQFLSPINPPSGGGGGTSGFIVPTVEPHRKVRWRWRAVARRSSQLKPYLPALPLLFWVVRERPPTSSGRLGRVPEPAPSL